MRILVSGYTGRKNTGIGRVFLEIIKRVGSNDQVFLDIYTNHDNKDVLGLENDQISVYKVPISKKHTLLNIIFNVLFFQLLSLRKRYDLVYISNCIPILLKFRPIVTVLHDVIELRLPQKFSKLRVWYRRLIIPTIVKKSNRLITVSNYSKKDILKLFNIPCNKIEVIYNAAFEPLHTDSLKAIDAMEKFELTANTYILYVGTITFPSKNIHNVIRGYEHYKSQFKDTKLKLVLCGMRGYEAEKIFKMIESSPFKDDIVYTGFVENDILEALYTNSSGTVFLSYYEGFGLPVLESMKYGIPVIASNRTSLPEIAGDAAYIVDPDDVAGIGESIHKILTDDIDEIKEKMAKNLTRFDWDRSAKKTIKVFQDTIRKPIV